VQPALSLFLLDEEVGTEVSACRMLCTVCTSSVCQGCRHDTNTRTLSSSGKEYCCMLLMVAFIINNPSVIFRFVRRDRSSPIKKNAFVRFDHRDAHYYVIVSHNSSVPMIRYLELAIRMCHGRGLQNSRSFSQMHPSRSGFDCEQI